MLCDELANALLNNLSACADEIIGLFQNPDNSVQQNR